MKRRVAAIFVAAVAVAAGAIVALTTMRRPLAPPVPADLADADRAFVELAERALAEVRTEPRNHERWLALGMVYEANQFTQLAEQCYETSASLGGGARATYHLAVLRGRVGDIPGAVDAMRQTIADDPSHGPAHWRLGFWLLDGHRLEEAESAFREAMAHRIGPFDLAGEIGMARVYMLRGQLDRAHAILEPLSKRPSPYAAYASHLLGTVLARKGLRDEATAALARGRGAEPVFPDPLHEQVNECRTDVEWLVTKAKGMVARGHYEPAIALLERAAGDRPADAMVRNNLAIALIGAGRLADATAQLERVLQSSPGSSQGHFNLALAARAQASLAGAADADALRAEALTHLDESLGLNPTFGAALGLKADMLRDQGHYQQALELYFQALATEPASATWWRGAALGAAACGRDDDAARCIAQLEALRPGDPQIVQLAREIEAMRSALKAKDDAPPVRSHDVGP